MPHEAREVRMRVVGWVLGVLALGVAAGFVAGLLRRRPPSDYHPRYEAPGLEPARPERDEPAASGQAPSGAK